MKQKEEKEKGKLQRGNAEDYGTDGELQVINVHLVFWAYPVNTNCIS